MKTVYRMVLFHLLVLSVILLSSFASMAATPGLSASPVSVSPVGASAVDISQHKATATTKLWEPPEPLLVKIVIGFVIAGSVVTMLVIRRALINSDWSLAEALSEDVAISFMTTDEQKKEQVKLDDSGKPIMVTVLRASVSRLIALMGMIIILLIFIGFGIFTLYSYAFTGEMPDSTGKVIQFLTGGLTLFAPYLVNKFAGIFDNLASKAKRHES
jgi:hypothetical protein